MKLDPRFLSIHPSTALWFEQRKLCDKCANCSRPPVKANGIAVSVYRCLAMPVPVKGKYGFCIEARDADGVCGPNATKFQPKE